MSKIKCCSIIRVFCIMILVVFVSNSSAFASLMTKDHKAIVIKAYQKFVSLKNYHMFINTTCSLSLKGKNMVTIVKSDSDVQVNPMMGKSTTDVTMNFAATKIEQRFMQYFEESANQITVYSKVNEQWVKQALPYYNPLKEYDNYIEAIKSVTPISEDANSIVFEVIADGSYMNENIERYLAATNMQKIKLNADLFKNLGDFKYIITVDKKNATISKIDIDMFDLMSKIGIKLAESKDIPDEQRTMIKDVFGNMKINSSVTFSKLNNVEDIIIPVEIQNAVQSDFTQGKSSNKILQSKVIGYLDVSRIMSESPTVKAMQNIIDQKGRELSNQLLIERSSLSAEEFKQRQQAIYQEFMELKGNLEKQIDESIKQVTAAIKKEKNLDFVIFKNTGKENIPLDSVDITSDVIDRMEVIKQ